MLQLNSIPISFAAFVGRPTHVGGGFLHQRYCRARDHSRAIGKDRCFHLQDGWQMVRNVRRTAWDKAAVWDLQLVSSESLDHQTSHRSLDLLMMWQHFPIWGIYRFSFFNWPHYAESQDGYAKKGCSMVEIMAIQVQRPHWFVSHAWIEPWIGKLSRLFETVLLHCLSATSFFFHPGSNNSYIKGRTWATVQIASQGSFCTKKWSCANLFVFAFIL